MNFWFICVGVELVGFGVGGGMWNLVFFFIFFLLGLDWLFFKKGDFFGWFNWIWVVFLFGWWGSGGGAEKMWNLVSCSWKGCECLISWPIGFEGFLNFGIVWVWLNCIDSVRECDFWVVLIGISVPFLPEEELKRKENC